MRIGPARGIDRDRPVAFQFDGTTYHGYAGDTLASALLANDVRLMGRSFKYHRPRGVVTAGSEEPNALVTVGRGAGQEPNVRATTLEIVNGLEARSQNAWPSLKHDALAVNDLVAPFLAAGFYYKTFMWPRAFWEGLYEPFIRRAAGLGALSGKTNDRVFEKAFAFCDVLVIGGGPAGLMAALTAARAGRDVILCDEGVALGGRLLAETEEVGRQPGADWAAGVAAELAAMENARVMTRTTVTGAYDQGTFGALERLAPRARPGARPVECFWRIVARDAVLCAGALERSIAFPDNDRPGVMMASAVRAYVNRWGVAPGKRVAIFGNNDGIYRTAMDLAAAGVSVEAVLDSRAEARDEPWRGYAGARVVATRGRHELTGITVEHAGGRRDIPCDCLAVSGGWNPTVHLTCHMNGRPTWDEGLASFVPTPGSVPGLVTAGACDGVMDTAGCLESGARVVADLLGCEVADVPRANATPYTVAPLWRVEGRGRKWLDLQNDVHVKDVELAVRENFTSVEHMKRYTTQGMAPDQGKNSNVAALAVLADASGRGIPQTGTTTFRPPFVPVSIAAMGAGAQGKGFAPERFTTSHAASVARGAPMIEAGLWYRPSYFPQPGETDWLTSCNREVAMVRQAVGICDVSTLGKIDVQGPDAAAFLDFVYANTISTLKAGRVRYGVMLREDGHAMDDGTVARLGPRQFVLTTTTAAAGNVMRHLEFVSQVLRPDWDVRLASVTEQWAQFAVAGPMSRDLLNTMLDEAVDDAAIPYMGCLNVAVSGVAGRLFRISFSGEHAYEIAVPARYGDALYRQLVAQAEVFGGGAYGMEALNVLRIEKGFLTHAEMHGRTTADDLGLGRMVSGKKDCIGKVMAARPGLSGAHRQQLVGLRPVNGREALGAGAHIWDEGTKFTAEHDRGYVTSVCWSPTLKTHLALGFVENGRARMGETVVVHDAMRKTTMRAAISDPVAYDPEGGRLRG